MKHLRDKHDWISNTVTIFATEILTKAGSLLVLLRVLQKNVELRARVFNQICFPQHPSRAVMSMSESTAALFMEMTAETRNCRVFLFRFHVILRNFRGFLV